MKVIINIDVPDLRAAIHFYTSALWTAPHRTLDDDVAELSGAAATIYLLQKDTSTPAFKTPPVGRGAPRNYGRHWTPVHFDLVVSDVDAAAARAIAAGATQETGHVNWRGSRCISFSDPFGHGFCFIQFEEHGTYSD